MLTLGFTVELIQIGCIVPLWQVALVGQAVLQPLAGDHMRLFWQRQLSQALVLVTNDDVRG